jgi:hypothetical protein
MTMRGVDFLEAWIGNNVAARPGNRTEARKLTDMLRLAAAGAGLTMADFEVEEGEVEKHILDSMVHLNELGTPGD